MTRWIFLLPLLLAVFLALDGLPSRSGGDANAQRAPRPVGKQIVPSAHKPTEPEPVRRDDSSAVIKQLMERREAVQGRTRRGQTIADAPPFKATTREEFIDYYPCGDCHEDQIANPRVRELKDEHEVLDFQHGGGRFWCYDACHNPKNLNQLVSLHGDPIGFNEAYKLCGQCHFQRQKDWFFGGHGKRMGTYRIPREIPESHSEMDFSDRAKIATWKGPRTLHNCTDCHDPHSPSIKPYEASPPPLVRRGLTRHKDRAPEHGLRWEAPGSANGEGK